MDQIIKSGESALIGVKLNRKFNYANVASTKKKKMTYTDFHSMMGHCGNDLIASMAKAMGVELIGKTFYVSRLYNGELKNKNSKGK